MTSEVEDAVERLTEAMNDAIADHEDDVARAWEAGERPDLWDAPDVTVSIPDLRTVLTALRAQAERVRVLEGERDEYGEIGERDGYERAVQDIDLLTGGDGEYRVSTQAARSCPDVATMKTRIAARFAEGQSAIERLMEQKRTTKALGCPHYGDLALRCAAAEARAEAAERRAGEAEAD